MVPTGGGAGGRGEGGLEGAPGGFGGAPGGWSGWSEACSGKERGCWMKTGGETDLFVAMKIKCLEQAIFSFLAGERRFWPLSSQ